MWHHFYKSYHLDITSIRMLRETAWERVYETLLCQQHINHSALDISAVKQSAIFSFSFDDPNLPPSPLVPADSKAAKKKAVFSAFHFVHQHYSTAGWGVVVLVGGRVYCYLFHLDVLSSTAGSGRTYSGHISAQLWRKHMLSHLCWQTQSETVQYVIDHFYRTPIIWTLFVGL